MGSQYKRLKDSSISEEEVYNFASIVIHPDFTKLEYEWRTHDWICVFRPLDNPAVIFMSPSRADVLEQAADWMKEQE